MAEIKYVFGTKRNPIVIHLGEYQGRPRVDIRKHYPSKDNTEELLPTRKGISLNHSQLEQFLNIVNSKKETVDDFLVEKKEGENFNRFIVIKESKGKPELTWVRIGVSDLSDVEIISGLDKEDTVFILPSKSLFDYQKRFKERVQASFSFG